jgi:hypothetical protein
VERDYAEFANARRANGFKSCLILCGGLLDALLPDALERNSARAAGAKRADKGKPLADWNLSTTIDVAGEISLVSQGAPRMANVVRDFRNLVHRGKERRGDYLIEAHEAAEAGLNAVIRDLRRRSTRIP